MVILITIINWLNSALKYSGIPIFTAQYMCMIAVLTYGVNFPFLFTHQEKIMEEMMKDKFINFQKT